MTTFHKLAFILALTPLLCAGCALSRMRLDAQVDRLCRKDAGVFVYETAPPAPEGVEWDLKLKGWKLIHSWSKPGLAERPESERGRITYIWAGRGYREVWEEEDLHGSWESSLRMYRYTVRLIRQADGKVMGKIIGYCREGASALYPYWRCLRHGECKGYTIPYHDCGERSSRTRLFESVFSANLKPGESVPEATTPEPGKETQP